MITGNLDAIKQMIMGAGLKSGFPKSNIINDPRGKKFVADDHYYDIELIEKKIDILLMLGKKVAPLAFENLEYWLSNKAEQEDFRVISKDYFENDDEIIKVINEEHLQEVKKGIFDRLKSPPNQIFPRILYEYAHGKEKELDNTQKENELLTTGNTVILYEKGFDVYGKYSADNIKNLVYKPLELQQKFSLAYGLGSFDILSIVSLSLFSDPNPKLKRIMINKWECVVSDVYNWDVSKKISILNVPYIGNLIANNYGYHMAQIKDIEMRYYQNKTGKGFDFYLKTEKFDMTEKLHEKFFDFTMP